MANKIQLRRDTAANWTVANPILAQGEAAYEIDTCRLKIGDGTTDFNTLPYKFESSLVESPAGVFTHTDELDNVTVIDISSFATSSTVAANAAAIATNTANITSNDADIAANTTDITTNTTDIAQEVTSRTNADAAIQSQIDSNDIDIAANASAITTNAGSISTHIADTSNPHNTTFTQAVAADPGTDITAAEAEQLTTGNPISLHQHVELQETDGTTRIEVEDGGDINLSAYTDTRIDAGVSQQALTTIDADGSVERRTILPFYAFSKKTDPEFNQTTTQADYDSLTVDLPEDGTYEIKIWCIWSQNSGATDINLVMNVDGTDVVALRMEPQDTAGAGIVATDVNGGTANTGTDQRYDAQLLEVDTYTAGTHTITLQWDASTTTDIPTIYRSIISIERKL